MVKTPFTLFGKIAGYKTCFLLGGLFATAAVFTTTSCNGNKPKTVAADTLSPLQRQQADSLQAVHEIDSTDYGLLFKNKTNAWLGKVLADSQSKWGNFHLVDYYNKEVKKSTAGLPGKKFLSDYGMFLIWSPDSTYILDFGSYSALITNDKQGNTFIESGDIDSEIRLFDVKAKASKRLWFFGAGTKAVNARWMDTAQVAMVVKSQQPGTPNPDTLLWLFNVKDNFFRSYQYHRQGWQ